MGGSQGDPEEDSDSWREDGEKKTINVFKNDLITIRPVIFGISSFRWYVNAPRVTARDIISRRDIYSLLVGLMFHLCFLANYFFNYFFFLFYYNNNNNNY